VGSSDPGKPTPSRAICILQIVVSVVLACGPILRLSTESDMSSARRALNVALLLCAIALLVYSILLLRRSGVGDGSDAPG
jgi:hypothetical protein